MAVTETWPSAEPMAAAVHLASGSPYPLGATVRADGVNFALFSGHATAVELCLHDRRPDGTSEEKFRARLRGPSAGVWHGFLPGVRAGQLYGYRVYGPYEPLAGHRFNPAKLLIDPWAKSLAGEFLWNDAVYGFDPVSDQAELLADSRDSADFVPKSVVVDDRFDWNGDTPPRTSWSRTVLYECHVKGLTNVHPEVPPELRGTYLGLCAPAVIDHLHRLGVTAVELLPIHYALDERNLAERGLVNYWAYNPIAFSAPAARYAAPDRGNAVTQFKTMVRSLHEAGIEVILDVVYNHTAESGQLGPTLSLRGIDNAVYYHLDPDHPRFFRDFTGCGNSVNVRHPRGLQLVMDSLRYWVEQMHVDGFRFDLTTVLARGAAGFEPDGPFLAAVAQDPVLAQVKLIAEPWDLGPGGYQVGGFPAGWSEWNDRYRDALRQYWKGDAGQLSLFARRICGSSDLFRADRGACASINFVTAHDGFTLEDLVSYEQKHNEANGENNRDGTSLNHSRNWGVEGPTEEVSVRVVRDHVTRAILATLAFSRGVPMLAAGDEMGRTQRGNNNAYCQDNDISWVNWELDARQRELLEFTRAVLAIRREYPALRACGFYQGKPVASGEPNDVTWLRPDGSNLTDEDWQDSRCGLLGMLIHAMIGTCGEACEVPYTDGGGRQTIAIYYNAEARGHRVTLPVILGKGRWMRRLNSAAPLPARRAVAGERIEVPARAVVLLEYAYDP